MSKEDKVLNFIILILMVFPLVLGSFAAGHYFGRKNGAIAVFAGDYSCIELNGETICSKAQ